MLFRGIRREKAEKKQVSLQKETDEALARLNAGDYDKRSTLQGLLHAFPIATAELMYGYDTKFSLADFEKNFHGLPYEVDEFIGDKIIRDALKKRIQGVITTQNNGNFSQECIYAIRRLELQGSVQAGVEETLDKILNTDSTKEEKLKALFSGINILKTFDFNPDLLLKIDTLKKPIFEIVGKEISYNIEDELMRAGINNK